MSPELFWAFGWLMVGSTVGSQFAGRSLVTVEAGALVTRWQMPFVGRTKRYDAGQVRHLRAASLAWPFSGFRRWSPRAAYPPWFGNPGSVQFDYGARTHPRALPGFDKAEGGGWWRSGWGSGAGEGGWVGRSRGFWYTVPGIPHEFRELGCSASTSQ